MNAQNPQTPTLETQLAALTTWTGPVPNLWRQALRATQAPVAGARRLTFPLGRWWLKAGGIAAAAALFLTLSVWIGDSLVPPDATSPPSPLYARQTEALADRSDFDGDGARSFVIAGGEVNKSGFPSNERFGGMSAGLPLVDRGRPPATGTPPPVAAGGPAGQDAGIDRHVIRKATVELVTPDVRAALLKATHLLSEARDEYVEQSSLSGTGRDIQANVTLRVAAERLSEVLNALRELGEVRSEQATGEDVTGQVVDLEARLRNEQRVEQDLLDLLAQRKDDPLKDVLEVRRALNDVRQTIEQLTAQRQRLGRLVSLATVLVIIRPTDAPPPPSPPVTGLWTEFVTALSRAWHTGVHYVVLSLALIVRVVVGGAVWWVLLVLAWFLAWRIIGRRHARTEPRP